MQRRDVVRLAAAVADGELVGGVGWEEFGDEFEAGGEGGRGEEGVFALAELGVVEIDGEREEIHGEGVGEGGVLEVLFFFFVDGALRFGSRGIPHLRIEMWGTQPYRGLSAAACGLRSR